MDPRANPFAPSAGTPPPEPARRGASYQASVSHGDIKTISFDITWAARNRFRRAQSPAGVTSRTLRHAALLVALILAPKATVIELEATIGARQVGHTTWTTTSDAGGGTTTVIDGTLTLQGATRRGIGRYVYRKDRRPISSEFRGSGDGPNYRSLQTYGATSVTEQLFSDGKLASSKSYAIPADAVLIDGTWEWFRNRVPKVGQKTTYHRLSSDGKWEPRTTTYVGKATLKLQGKPVACHLVDGDGLKSWLDDKGDALGMDLVIAGQTVSLRRTSIKRT